LSSNAHLSYDAAFFQPTAAPPAFQRPRASTGTLVRPAPQDAGGGGGGAAPGRRRTGSDATQTLSPSRMTDNIMALVLWRERCSRERAPRLPAYVNYHQQLCTHLGIVTEEVRTVTQLITANNPMWRADAHCLVKRALDREMAETAWIAQAQHQLQRELEDTSFPSPAEDLAEYYELRACAAAQSVILENILAIKETCWMATPAIDNVDPLMGSVPSPLNTTTTVTPSSDQMRVLSPSASPQRRRSNSRGVIPNFGDHAFAV
jgi:hypothetical protein